MQTDDVRLLNIRRKKKEKSRDVWPQLTVK